jgi:hypothetical protein
VKPSLQGKTIGQALDDVISESLASAMQTRTQKEQGRQKDLASQCNTAGSMSELEEEDEGGDSGDDDEDKDAKKSDDDGGGEKKSDDDEKRTPEADDVVDKLNAFRSGRSFRDEEVQSSFNNYFEKLSDAEKMALYTFAKGIAQIVTGEVPSKNAAEPGDHPADVKMTRSGPQKRSVDPNVIKKAAPKDQGKPTSDKGEEDTTPPSPIKAK